MKHEFFNTIEQADIITIFRHVGADSDALGSQFGLKTWICDKYPDKCVYALGEDIGSCANQYPNIDHVDDDIIKKSLAIILDTANTARIDDERWILAAQTMKVDHHIQVEKFGNIQIVNEAAGATCEIIATLLLNHQEKLSIQCATYLYSGLIADTLQFSIASTTSKTLLAAAYLADCGINIPNINQQNFTKSKKEYVYETYLRSHMRMKGEQIAYTIVSKTEYESFNLTLNEAKEKVYAFANVEEFEIWALFVENGVDADGEVLFNGSLRSRNTAIDEIANKYHGGGHKLACGVKSLHEPEIECLLNELLQAIA
ncbi:MAG: bifunctional oligoribonuclease/PAP phosphatase NrnA [Erysipelotrichaceae bacterium]